MTRGQDSLLDPSCVTLSFTTPRRFIPAHPLPCRLGPPSLSVSQDRYLSTRRTEANGRERRFPVFERLVEALPEIPEEPTNCAFRQTQSGRHPARQAPLFLL